VIDWCLEKKRIQFRNISANPGAFPCRCKSNCGSAGIVFRYGCLKKFARAGAAAPQAWAFEKVPTDNVDHYSSYRSVRIIRYKENPRTM
jgi:hypothetical protein